MRFADTIALVSSGVNINVPVCMLLKSERQTSLDTCVCPLELNKYVFNQNLFKFYTLIFYTSNIFYPWYFLSNTINIDYTLYKNKLVLYSSKKLFIY